MAHIQDRWLKVVGGEQVRTAQHGKGMRWQARFRDQNGAHRAKFFVQKQNAELFRATVTADVLRGSYISPHAGKVTFGHFADRFIAQHSCEETTRASMESRMR